ncbi:hypothetical protein Fmac_028067 [Flemingia macrophylla]|uniref:Uncharacterized protein n=1 Tax=Flemingia macrophylla TaxID=520843 RepID=A0ABD1LK42_9FABA
MGLGSGQRGVETVSGKSYACIQNELTRASHGGAATVANPWSFGEPETKRKKRIARYKVYAVEAKVKASLRNGIRWIKVTCSRLVHGY